MSATPIPRSLALALYSDLDHSVIAEGPRGRLPVETRVHAIDRDGDVDWSAIASRAREGCPTFIVFPAIESVEGGRPSVLGEGRRVARRYFRKIPVAALHGRLEHAEKTRVLDEFRTGVVKVLFCTTILEVGIDVPDATDVVIVGAECFGLSQLHQIRGRVGRGGAQGRCLLVSGGKKAALDRLELLAATSDGFQIAELDLETRGPGDMMGLRQHGFGALPGDEAEAELLAGAVEDARLLGVDEASRGALSRSLRAWWDARDIEMTEPGQAG